MATPPGRLPSPTWAFWPARARCSSPARPARIISPNARLCWPGPRRCSPPWSRGPSSLISARNSLCWRPQTPIARWKAARPWARRSSCRERHSSNDVGMMVRATLIGFSAILMWSLLALFSSLSGAVPPFLLCTFSFAVATVVGLIATGRSKPRAPGGKVPLIAWIVGIGGLFGYHCFYFSAVRSAPVIEANLINYLWPLLIVLGSALMPGEGLRWHHVAGAALGLAGTVLIVSDGGRFAFDAQYLPGYGLGILAAVTWASYSLMSRRFAAIPTRMVTWYCAAAAILSLVCHLLLEETVLPADATQWLAVLG